MAKYRPIAQEHIWRNPSCAGLPGNARLALLYLLAGSFTNTIGAYPVHPGIAAAEMELETTDEFITLLRQLQNRSLVHFEDGIIIVAAWFRHNTWESTLQGKVQKLAEREYKQLPQHLRTKWIEFSLAAGVPRQAIENFIRMPLASPIDTEQQQHHSHEHNYTEQKINITTTAEPNSSGGQSMSALYLTDAAEPYRQFIERALQALPHDDAQQIADECSGTLEASTSGKRPPICGFHQWLPTLVENFRSGKFAPQWGPEIARRRHAAQQQAQQQIAHANQQRQNNDEYQRRCNYAEMLLLGLSVDELEQFADLANRRLLTHEQKSRARMAVLNRQLDNGMVKSTIVETAERWLLSSANTIQPH